ncbi:MAG TPA: ABC transporter substrate-binding protein [Pseudolabrys sp.]|jgi:putative ABC transport system substrate-binding protein|nr:ABC transporter substrate-binding protein [Pseudolabrys sp.]
MRRRAFITLLGGAVVWPVVTRAQQSEGVRRIGVLMNRTADDPQGQARLAAFQQRLQQLGWTDGGNVRIETRWGADDVDRERRSAAELVALVPDIVLASGTLSVTALQHASSALPIVFVGVTDPVGAGFVDSLARPGGNITGFMIYEYNLSGKWLELLKQIAPSITRVAVIRNPENPVGVAVFSALRAAAQPLRVEVSPVDSRLKSDEIERAITAFAGSPNSGLILTPNAAAMPAHYSLIVKLAARYKLPAVYPFSEMVTNGGLMSYGPDVIDQSRHAAEYVDRILKGEKPSELPVQQATKFELRINLKTAKGLGLEVPNTLIGLADEIIE